MHLDDGMGWWMLWGGLMMVLFWGAIIALVVWGVQTLARRDTGRAQPAQATLPRSNPLDIAMERYAGGNIDRDEFVKIKRDLEGS